MAFTPSGPSVRLAVSSAGESVSILGTSNQCRVWNEGPNACRIRYTVSDLDIAVDTDMVLPPGLIEVHTKSNATRIAGKCAAGETAVLHIIVGSGD